MNKTKKSRFTPKVSQHELYTWNDAKKSKNPFEFKKQSLIVTQKSFNLNLFDRSHFRREVSAAIIKIWKKTQKGQNPSILFHRRFFHQYS